MLLSSSVIKNTKVIELKDKEIVTARNAEVNDSIELLQEELRKNGNTEYDAIDKIGAFIIENAKRAASDLHDKAFSEAQQIQKNAYEKGFEEGKEAGYKQAYEETVVRGKQEIENLKSLTEQNASNLMKNAKYNYEVYLTEKEDEIKRLALTIAK